MPMQYFATKRIGIRGTVVNNGDPIPFPLADDEIRSLSMMAAIRAVAIPDPPVGVVTESKPVATGNATKKDKSKK